MKAKFFLLKRFNKKKKCEQRVVCKCYQNSSEKTLPKLPKTSQWSKLYWELRLIICAHMPIASSPHNYKKWQQTNTLLRNDVHNILPLVSVFEYRERARVHNRMSLKRFHIKCNNLIKYLDCIKLKLNQTMQTDTFKKLQHAKFISKIMKILKAFNLIWCLK